MASAALTLARRCAEQMLANDLASRALGIKVEIPAVGEAIATMTVNASMVNGHAVCHGGYLFTLADSAFAFACNAYNQVTLATAGSIDFVASARLGDQLVAHARQQHRRGKSGVYDVSVGNAEGVRIALFRGRSLSRDEAIV